MDKSMIILLSVVLLGAVVWTVRGPQRAVSSPQSPQMNQTKSPGTGDAAIATFAGGCFWCIEPAFQEEPGVINAVVGYAGGQKEHPSYKEVSSGQTKYKEAVQVTYDANKISYEQLLDIFWSRIDPTDAGGQFVDRGPQYTTAIFYHTEQQKQLAEQSKQQLAQSDKFDEPIVTEILPYTTFYLAEAYHQDFYKNSSQRYKQYKENSGREEFFEQQATE